MPGCGDTYRHLIRSNAGKSPDKPCEGIFGAELYCNDPDYADWYAGMVNIRKKMQTKLSDLRGRAQAANRLDVVDGLVIYTQPAEAGFSEIKSPEDFGMSWPGSEVLVEGISNMIGTMEFYACALEQIDLAYARLGQTVPGTPGVITPKTGSSGRDWAELAFKAVKVVGLVGGLYVVGRYVLPHVVGQRRPAYE